MPKIEIETNIGKVREELDLLKEELVKINDLLSEFNDLAKDKNIKIMQVGDLKQIEITDDSVEIERYKETNIDPENAKKLINCIKKHCDYQK